MYKVVCMSKPDGDIILSKIVERDILPQYINNITEILFDIDILIIELGEKRE